MAEAGKIEVPIDLLVDKIEVTKLELGPDDVLAIIPPPSWTAEMCRSLNDSLGYFWYTGGFPGKVIVMPEGVKLEVVHGEPGFIEAVAKNVASVLEKAHAEHGAGR